MRHRLRSLVWRELPYSVRHSILGVLHAFDDFEDFWRRIWQSLDFSPAWLFVASVGTLGVGLTILLFFMLAQELFVDRSLVAAPKPIIEPARLAADDGLLDSRLCLDAPPPVIAAYPAEFDRNSGIMMTDYQAPVAPRVAEPLPDLPQIERRPPSRSARPAEPTQPPEDLWPSMPVAAEPVVTEPAVAEPVDVPFERLPPRRQPVVNAQPASESVVQIAEPELLLDVQSWRQPAAPDVPAGKEQTATARSENRPVNRTAPLDWNQSSPWTWYRERPQKPQTISAYTGDSRLQMEQPDESLWDDFSAWPNQADVALQVQLYAPHSATVLQPNRSRLVVRNTGNEAIRRIEIQEPIRLLDQVTSANPPAALADSTLYRELYRLGAGREKSLELDWTAPNSGDRHHEARILAEVFVAASVDVAPAPEPVTAEPVRSEPEVIVTPVIEVEPEPRYEPVPDPAPEPVRRPAVIVEPPEEFGPPPAAARPSEEPRPVAEPVREIPAPAAPSIACSVSGKDQIPVRGVAEFTIVVSNDGNTPLSGVFVWADLPENLQHRYGNRLQMPLGQLAPGERRQAVLRVIGSKVGISRARIQAVSTQTTSADADAFLAVIPASLQAPARQQPAGPGCACPCPQVSLRLPRE